MLTDDPWFDADTAIGRLAPGHYPTITCFDEREGSFGDVDFWDGEEWNRWATRHYIPIRHEVPDDALLTAQRLFPGWANW